MALESSAFAFCLAMQGNARFPALFRASTPIPRLKPCNPFSRYTIMDEEYPLAWAEIVGWTTSSHKDGLGGLGFPQQIQGRALTALRSKLR